MSTQGTWTRFDWSDLDRESAEADRAVVELQRNSLSTAAALHGCADGGARAATQIQAVRRDVARPAIRALRTEHRSARWERLAGRLRVARVAAWCVVLHACWGTLAAARWARRTAVRAIRAAVRAIRAVGRAVAAACVALVRGGAWLCRATGRAIAAGCRKAWRAGRRAALALAQFSERIVRAIGRRGVQAAARVRKRLRRGCMRARRVASRITRRKGG